MAIFKAAQGAASGNLRRIFRMLVCQSPDFYYGKPSPWSNTTRLGGNVIRNGMGLARRALWITPRVPQLVSVEITTDCNLQCPMCRRQTLNFEKATMPYETFTSIVDRLPSEVEMLAFGGYGEMLMHPRFFDMVRYSKNKGLFTQLTSNGLLLKTQRRIHRLFDCGLDELRISVDHVHAPQVDYDVGHVFSPELLKNLRKLSDMRAEYRNQMRLIINTVVQTGNFDEVVDIIRFAEELKLDLVELVYLDTCENRAERSLHPGRERALYKMVDRTRWQIEVVTPTNRFGGLLGLTNLMQEFCPLRYKSMHVRTDGTVTPCAVGFAAHNFGSIFERPVEEIWQSPAFRAVRANHKNPVCAVCSIFKGPPA